MLFYLTSADAGLLDNQAIGPLAAVMAALAGFVAGSLHVFAGPDHLAAVAPLTAGGRGKGWGLGLRWGLGHATGAALIAAVAFTLRRFIHLETLAGWSERLVGVVLIGVGVWALRQAFRRRLHTHEHAHGGETHAHVHVHEGDARHDAAAEPAAKHTPHRHGHAAFAVGTLHGAAGSHHIVGLLPALALPSNLLAAVYLVAFALGNVVGMTLFAGLVGTLFARLGEGGNRAYSRLLGTTAVVAIGVGVFWLWP